MSKRDKQELTHRMRKEAKRAVKKQPRQEHFITAADVAALPAGTVVEPEQA